MILLASATPSALSAEAEQVATPPPFDTAEKPPAPDYASPRAWALRPTSVSHPVDVFYIHPTTFPGPAWNQDINDAAANAVTDHGVMKSQATAFSGCCDIYAPRYRQASAGSLAAFAGDGGKAFDLAYQDMQRAFAYYLSHDNHGRPFILAGHSQGALHAARLLEEMIDGKPEADRLVAAYIVGIGVSEGMAGKAYKTVRICGRPDDTGCFVSWNTFVWGSDVDAYVKRSEGRYVSRFGDDAGKALLCVNPLTFDLDKPAADVNANLGSVSDPAGSHALEAAATPALKAGIVRASCDQGILFAQSLVGSDILRPLPGGSLHLQDVELFYGNLRENAAVRSRAWLARAKR
jgi:hypothetical protein